VARPVGHGAGRVHHRLVAQQHLHPLALGPEPELADRVQRKPDADEVVVGFIEASIICSRLSTKESFFCVPPFFLVGSL
jgi:hypothetical protein